jgi:iron complex outermembrane receptor protein
MEGPNTAQRDTTGISAEFAWDSSVGSLLIVPSYSKSESSDSGNYEEDDGTIYQVYNDMEAIQKGVDARLTSDPDFFFKWIVGASWFEHTQDRITSYSNPAEVGGSNSTLQKNYGVYANVTYPVTDRLRGTAGYRRSWDTSQNIEIPAKVGDGVSGQEYTAPDYKLGIEYDLADNSMMYADYSTSYRINAMIVDQGSKSGEPEELKAYTAGIKNRFLDNKLQVNVSGFYYDYTNKGAQVSGNGRFGMEETHYEDEVVDPDGNYMDLNNDGDYGDPSDEIPGQVTDPWIQQFGGFESYGADLSTEWLLTANDRLNLGVSYLTTEWTDLTVEFYWKQLVDGNVVAFWDDDGADYSGFENTFSPNWTVTAGYEHHFELGSLGRLVPRFDLTWKDDYILDYAPINSIVADQEAYYTVDGSLTYTSPGSMWSVNAYVKNATNYAAKTFFMNMAGTYTLGISEPRMYGVIVSARF